MSDRDELAALIYQHFGTPDGDIDALNAADAILARWRLVPVEQKSCAYEDHIVYESCGICGDIPEEIADQERRS